MQPCATTLHLPTLEWLESRTFLSVGFDLVLIDGSLAAQEAVARSAHAGAVVVMFDAARDSAADVLKNAVDLAVTRGELIASVSIVSHGSSGRFELGCEEVNQQSLAQMNDDWSALGSVMIADGNIYLLSCEVASGADGQRLVKELARVTHQDVFASRNVTGEGGDWILEEASSGAGAELSAGLHLPFDMHSLALVNGLTLSIPSGTEFRANTTTSNTQNAGVPRAVAADSSGNYVVAWESYNQDSLLTYGVYAQRFNAAGVAQGAEFLVNTVTLLNDQRKPAVAMNASGAFVIAWEGTGLLGLFPGIYAQRYNAAGVAQGSEIAIAGTLFSTFSEVSVAMDSSGKFVVAYEGPDANGEGVFARRYAADGTALGASFAVNVTTSGNQISPDIAITSSGGFVIGWSGEGVGDTTGIFASVYDSSGTAIASEVAVNLFTTGTQTNAAVAASSAGDIVIAWSGRGVTDTTGILAQRLDSSLALAGSVLEVNVTTGGTQSNASVAIDGDGDFVVVWSGNGSGDTSGVFGREYAANGTARTSEYLINTTTSGTQANASIACAGDNAYIVSWDGEGTGDTSGVFGQLFVNDPPTATTTGSTLAYTENDGAVAVDSGVTVDDLDSADLVSATVSISGNYVNGEDVLAFVDQLGITGSWVAATGVLTLSGVASLADYKIALAAVTYANGSNNPTASTRTVSFVVNDGSDDSIAVTRAIAVTGVNDAPTVTTTGSSLGYTENDGAVVVDSGVSLADLDNTTLASATVTISGNYVNGEDVLAFADQLGITGSWAAGTGVLTLSGVASLANYQIALRSITYTNVSDNPSVVSRTVSFVVNDGTDPSAAATRTISLTAVNDAPTATTTGSSLGYTENGGAVVVDAGIALADLDNATLASATVTISANYVNGEDVLAFADQLGITGSWVAATGVLTLSGVTTLANYQTALRAVTYANGSDNPSVLSRTVSFVVHDGTDPSVAATRTIAITAVNDAPTVTTTLSNLAYTENDGAVVVDSGVTLADMDNTTLASATIAISGNYVNGEDVLAFADQLGITGSWIAATGVLTLSGVTTLANYQTALRSITYTNGSNNPAVLSRTVEWVVNDGTDPSAAATRTIAIAAVNDVPTVTTTGSSLAYTENDGAVVVDSGVTVADADNTTLSSATITISGNYVNGEDVLAFTDQLGITGSWVAATGVLTLSGVTTLANYQTALRVVTYANGSNNPSVLSRTVEWVVNDGTDPSAAATRTIAITAVNDVPTVTTTGSSLAYTENDGAVVVDSGISLADLDNTTLASATVTISGNYVNGEDVLAFVDQLGITGSWVAATGVLTLSGVANLANYQIALRSITYSNGSDNPSVLSRTISFVVHDGTDPSAAATRTIAITAVNDPPTVITTGSSLAYTENDGAVVVDSGVSLADQDNTMLASATITISANYVNGEDVLAFADQLGITGSWVAATGVLTLSGVTTLANYQTALRAVTYANGSNNPSVLSRTVSFVVHDGTDPSAAATRTIAMTAVNDAPTVTTTGSSLAYTENDGAVEVDSGVTVGDVDNTTLAGATITISANYVNGEDVLTFADQLGITGSWVAATGVLTLSGVTTLANYQTALRAVTYANGSDNPSVLSRTISFVVNDGTDPSAAATRTIAITAVNDAPTVTTTGSSLGYTENDGAAVVDSGVSLADLDNTTLASATVTISANYVNGEDVLAFADQLGITGSWAAGTGVLTLSGVASLANYQIALRSITYTNVSDNPSVVSRTVSFVVNDGTDPSAAATRTIAITAVNDFPTVSTTGSSLAYTENDGAVVMDAGVTLADLDNTTLASATVTISGNYVNGEDVLAFVDQLGITGSWVAATGVLTLSGVTTLANYQTALRAVTYANVSDNPSVLSRTVLFVVNDGTDPSAAASRTIAMTATNDAPTVTTTGSSLAYTENDGAVIVDSGVALADLDNTTLASATVTISANYVNGEDLLAFVDQLGITGNWVAATGVLTLSGVATLANYQTALRAVTYANGSDNPSVLSRTVSFVVHDGTDPSTAATRTMAITSVNDAPTVTTTGSSLAYTENDGAVAVDSGVTVGDVDNTTLASATVTINGNYVNGEDVLAFTDQLGITGSWVAATGVLTLSGAATLANYQAALRSITYANGSDNPSVLSRTVSFVVHDGTDPSVAATRTIAITAVNDAPTVTTTLSNLAYTENDGAVVVDSGISLADLDNTTLAGATITISGNYVNGEDVLAFVDQLGITGSWVAATGVLTLSGAATLANYQTALRSITYANGSDNPSVLSRTISFVVQDGTDPSAASTRTIAITAVNDVPTVSSTGSSLTYTENDGTVVVDSGISLADLDNTTLTSATVTISANYVNGEDVLAFVDQLGITGSWVAATGVLTLSGVASLANYQIALRSITYANGSDNPSALSRTVSFVVNDGTDPSAAATRTIAITAVNDVPTVTTTGSSLAYTENDGAVVVDSGISLADLDNTTLASATVTISGNYVNGEDVLSFADQLGITGSWVAATGVLTLSGVTTLANYQTALRAVTYANGSDNPAVLSRTISFVVNDGTDPSSPATRTIAITAVNDPPTVTTTGSSLAYTENDGAVVVDNGISLADLDNTTLAGATVTISGNYVNGEDVLAFADQLGITGSWVAATGVLTLSGITTLANYQTALRSITYANGSDNPSVLSRTVEWVANDGVNANVAAQRAITVSAVNDAPTVTLSGPMLTYTENSGTVVLDPALVLADIDSLTLTGATVLIAANYVMGQDVLVFNNQSGITGTWVAATGTLTLSGTASVASYQIAMRSIAYLNGSENPFIAPRTVYWTVNDGVATSATASRAVAIIAVNDAPVVNTAGSVLTYVEGDGAVAVDSSIVVMDVDNAVLLSATVTISGNYVLGEDVLTFVDQMGITGVWNAANGVLTLTGSANTASFQTALRTITYSNTSESPATAQRTVAYVVHDGIVSSAAATRSITLNSVNDAPTASVSGSPLVYVENAGGVLVDNGVMLADADSAALSGATVTISSNYVSGEDVLRFAARSGITATWSAANGMLTLTGGATVAAYQLALRSITYSNSSDAPSLAPRMISYVVFDGAASSASVARAVSITATNDAPTLFTSGSTLWYAVSDGSVMIDQGLLLADLDNVTLQSATVRISANFRSGEDILAFAGQPGISGTWDGASGVLTLSGAGTVAAYQAALRTVTYTNSVSTPSMDVRTVTWLVNDGTQDSAAAATAVFVMAVHSVPVGPGPAEPSPNVGSSSVAQELLDIWTPPAPYQSPTLPIVGYGAELDDFSNLAGDGLIESNLIDQSPPRSLEGVTGPISTEIEIDQNESTTSPDKASGDGVLPSSTTDTNAVPPEPAVEPATENTKAENTMQLDTALSPELMQDLARLHEQLQASAGNPQVAGVVVACSAFMGCIGYSFLNFKLALRGAAILQGEAMWGAFDPASILRSHASTTRARYLWKK